MLVLMVLSSTVTELVADAKDIALARLTTGGVVGIALVVVDLQAGKYLPQSVQLW